MQVVIMEEYITRYRYLNPRQKEHLKDCNILKTDKDKINILGLGIFSDDHFEVYHMFHFFIDYEPRGLILHNDERVATIIDGSIDFSCQSDELDFIKKWYNLITDEGTNYNDYLSTENC